MLTTHTNALRLAGFFLLLHAACRPLAPAQPPASRLDAVPADSDGDGWHDPSDRCPQTRGVEPHGCPILEADAEGRLDPGDRCPDLPETMNGYQEDDGCPDEIPVQRATFTGKIKGIYFDSLKITIKANSKPVLDRAIQVLAEFNTINIEITCHESSAPGVPSPVYAPALVKFTLRRANAVKRYLVERGVAPERVLVRGAGASEPVDTNDTASGRARNRRCDFVILVR